MLFIGSFLLALGPTKDCVLFAYEFLMWPGSLVIGGHGFISHPLLPNTTLEKPLAFVPPSQSSITWYQPK